MNPSSFAGTMLFVEQNDGKPAAYFGIDGGGVDAFGEGDKMIGIDDHLLASDAARRQARDHLRHLGFEVIEGGLHFVVANLADALVILTTKPRQSQHRLRHRLGDFHPNSLGVAAHMVRIQRDEKQREFAKAAGLSASTVCRIERADEVLIESVLKMCALLGRHPHDFVSQAVPRETQTAERRSAA